MKVGGAWKLGVSSRSLMLVVPLCALLLASAIGNVRQYRLAEQQRVRAVAVERDRAEAARAEAERAKLKRQAAAATSARVDQLYQEINNLTRMSEHVLLRNPNSRSTPPEKGNSEDIASRP